MTPHLFPGKLYGAEMKADLKKKIAVLQKKKQITPTLAIIKVSNAGDSAMYTKVKEKAAAEVGAKVDIYDFSKPNKTARDITQIIRFLNADPEIHGVMVQLPFPRRLKGKEPRVLTVIDPTKDVDGLAPDSPFTKPVVLSVLRAVEEFQQKVTKQKKLTIVVFGALGMVGKSIVAELEEKGHIVKKIDKKMVDNVITFREIRQKVTPDTNLIISAIGKGNKLAAELVPDGVGLIDIGAPEPDVNISKFKDKLSFHTPTPGGIGPLTVGYLLENLYSAAYNSSL